MPPDLSRGLELYCNAKFAGTLNCLVTAWIRLICAIVATSSPMLASLSCRKRLSRTESKIIGLSAGLCTTIPLQLFLNEMKQLGFEIVPNGPVIQCTAFEDNNGALAIASVPQMCPRTKHINTKYLHFVEYTIRKDAPFSFERIDTEHQPADLALD